jgi:hypothetical protein
VWLPLSALQKADLPPELSARLLIPDRVPTDVTISSVASAEPAPLPDQGSLIVVASPGDHVRLGESTLPVGPDGVLVLTAPRGAVLLEIIGGGRIQTVQTLMPAQHAVYLRAEAPPRQLHIPFALNSDRVDDLNRAEIARVVSLAGDWSFELLGSASPEGDRKRNLALAEGRAREVQAELQRLGVPAERVRLLPAIVGEAQPGGDPAQLRYAILRPVAPGGGP